MEDEMAFRSSNTPTEDDLWSEQIQREVLELQARVPRSLRILIRRTDVYSIDNLIADTISHAPDLGDLLTYCRSSSTLSLSDSDISRGRLRLALALEQNGDETRRDIALCWRILGGMTQSPAIVRLDLGSRVVAAFDEFVDSGRSYGTGLHMACDLMLAVAGWSVACHRGRPSMGMFATTPWLLPIAGNVAETLAETGAMHPDSSMMRTHRQLLGDYHDLTDRYDRLAVDKSRSNKDIFSEEEIDWGPDNPRTLH